MIGSSSILECLQQNQLAASTDSNMSGVQSLKPRLDLAEAMEAQLTCGRRVVEFRLVRLPKKCALIALARRMLQGLPGLERLVQRFSSYLLKEI